VSSGETADARARRIAGDLSRRARSALRPQLPFPYGPPPTPNGVDSISKPSTKGADFDTDWARRPSARVARGAFVETMLRPTVAVLARPTRSGLDRLADLPDDEPAIFVANHHSHIDTPLLLTSIPEPWRRDLVVAAAADYFFANRVSGAAAALTLGAIPMERHRGARSSANRAAELLRDGWSLLIFPEGGRSKDGWGQEFRGGASYLAQRSDVPVVPIHLTGTGRILRKGHTLPKPAPTTVNFGYPLRAEPDESTRSFGARIEAAVTALADESSSDWWTARQRAHAGDSPSMTGPEAASWRRSWALGDPGRKAGSRKQRWPYV